MLFVSLVLIVFYFLLSPLTVLSDPPATFRLLFAGTTLGAVGTVVTAGIAGHSWTNEAWDWRDRIQYTAVTISLLASCWLLWYWNLLVPPGVG